MPFVWAKVRLGAEYSPCFDSFAANRLIDTGPYAYVRHPIYVANLAWLLGAFLATGWRGLHRELRDCRILFCGLGTAGDALAKKLPTYGEYMARTGAFLPPLRRPASQDMA